MTRPRVAIIFDDAPRPETSGVYCRRALEELGEVVHFRPSQLAEIPRNGFDLYLAVDDGLEYTIPSDLRPSGYWAIDTHLDFDWRLLRSRGVDFAFAAQRDGAERLREAGIDHCQWLPLACDPSVHRRHDVPNRFDIAFVGNALPGQRTELVQLIARHFPRSFAGRAYFDDMARLYSSSHLTFNRSVLNDVNMRVFEAVACGSLLLTNNLSDNGLDELFHDGVHLAVYSDPEELIDKIRFYLAHAVIRDRIAAAGRELAYASHTYAHRMRDLLGVAVAGRRHFIFAPVPVNARTGCDASTQRKSKDHSGADSASTLSAAPVRDRSYFEWSRPEILELVPTTARRVLELGCAAGRLGAAIKARQGAEVVGVELDPLAVARARERLDSVIEADLNDGDLPRSSGSFDCAICADVLEHLESPREFLRKIHRWLTEDGTLVVSLPNVRNASVVAGLLAGNWTYETAGLLDKTHRHFFTRRDAESLLRDAGFTVGGYAGLPAAEYAAWQNAGRPGEVRLGGLTIENLAPDDAAEFYTYQHLLVARRRSTRRRRDHAADEQRLRILHLGRFDAAWSNEREICDALRRQGHEVTAVHEFTATAEALAFELRRERYDCLLFHKGRIGARDMDDILHPTGESIARFIESSDIPSYLWYFDRAFGYDFDLSREAWMRRVAPLCRVAFVVDGGLLATDWARWRLLRQGAFGFDVSAMAPPEHERRDLAFVGQLFGDRQAELAQLSGQFHVEHITSAFGPELGDAVRRFRIVLGPSYPSVPGYWSNRLYLILGHGGFFLAPEVKGMRDEGFLPDVHYARLGDDPCDDVRRWLSEPEGRERIVRQGADFVRAQHTLAHRVEELCRVMQATCRGSSERQSALADGLPTESTQV